MPDILIRGVSQAIADALAEKAKIVGVDRQTWLLSQLELLVATPAIRERYAYRVYGVNGKGVVRRDSNHPNGTVTTCNGFSQEEFDAFHKAADYMRRNAPGDREKAVGLLHETFEEVIEISA